MHILTLSKCLFSHSTIEALDLNNLDDDPVLKAEQEGTLAQGIAEMWATAASDPATNTALDAIVQEVATEQGF